MPEKEKDNMDKTLDMIHEIAAEAISNDGIPIEVEKALDEIISISRYKFPTVERSSKAEE